MKRDDTLWKAILEDLFDDFLRFFFPEAETLIDLEKGFEFLDKELEDIFPMPDEEKKGDPQDQNQGVNELFACLYTF